MILSELNGYWNGDYQLNCLEIVLLSCKIMARVKITQVTIHLIIILGSLNLLAVAAPKAIQCDAYEYKMNFRMQLAIYVI